MTDLAKACLHALKHNLGLQAHERVLIVTDENRLRIAEAFKQAAQTITENIAQIEIPVPEFNGQEPPAEAARKMLHADVVLMPVTRSLSWTRARMAATDNGARVASMGGGLDEDIIRRTLVVDYRPIRERVNRLCDLLDSAREIHVTNGLGTDIRMSAQGRPGRGRKGGIYTEPGYWGNLPCGEAFIAPVEGSARGVYVVDASHAGVGKVETPITIEVENGRAVSISGGAEAKTLERMLVDFGDAKAYNIAEFGIGCNDKAQITGATIEDEKKLGTCHIALGNNALFGGTIDVGIHVDGVMRNPSIYFDGKCVMQEGKLML